MRRSAIAIAAALAALSAPAAADAACKQKFVKFEGSLALDGGLGGPPGAAVETGKAKVDPFENYVATSDVSLTYRKVTYEVEKGSEFSLGCFKPTGGGNYRAGSGRYPLLLLGEGTVEVNSAKRAAREAGVSMRYGLFHGPRAAGGRWRVSYDWINVSIGRGRAKLDTLKGPAVGFSPGSVAALQGQCQAGETMIVDWKGVRQG